MWTNHNIAPSLQSFKILYYRYVSENVSLSKRENKNIFKWNSEYCNFFRKRSRGRHACESSNLFLSLFQRELPIKCLNFLQKCTFFLECTGNALIFRNVLNMQVFHAAFRNDQLFSRTVTVSTLILGKTSCK